MLANYHTHTFRCGHASPDTERAYIEQGIRNGLKILGFSDHSPYCFFDADRYAFHPRHRMATEQFADYCQTLSALRSEYAGKIELHIGLEMEYLPKYFAGTLEWMRQFPLEYLILGQHFTKNEYDGAVCGAATEDEAVLAQYAAQVIEGIRTGCFSYVAHPDVLRYTGPDEIYARHMLPLCVAAKEADIPLELNLLGLEDGRHYPNRRFWQLAAQVKNKTVIGCDAHRAERVAKPETVSAGEAYLAEFGLVPEKTLTFRDPFAIL